MTLQSTTIVTPQPGAPEGHDAAMIAKVNASTAAATAAAGGTPAVTVKERPADVPEKFWDAEKGEIRVADLVKSYTELESKGGVKPPVTPPVVDPAAAVADPAVAAAAAAQAGLDLAALETEFRTDGKLSDGNLAKLKAAGFSETDVATYIAGRQALVTQFETDVLAEVPGGAEKFGEMAAWAQVNLTPAELTAYNKAIDSNDVNQAKLAVAGVHAKFAASVGNEPTLVGGRSTAAQGDVYESMAQVTADMKSPLYKSDPAFRAKVQAKLGRSSV